MSPPPIIRDRLTYGIVVCFIVCYPITRLIINMNYRFGVTEAVMIEMKQNNVILWNSVNILDTFWEENLKVIALRLLDLFYEIIK